MKVIGFKIWLILTICGACMVTYGSAVEAKYSEEEILDALQKKIEL